MLRDAVTAAQWTIPGHVFMSLMVIMWLCAEAAFKDKPVFLRLKFLVLARDCDQNERKYNQKNGARVLPEKFCDWHRKDFSSPEDPRHHNTEQHQCPPMDEHAKYSEWGCHPQKSSLQKFTAQLPELLWHFNVPLFCRAGESLEETTREPEPTAGQVYDSSVDQTNWTQHAS